MRFWAKPARVFILVGMALSLGACHHSASSQDAVAPSFELKDLTGKTVRLEDFRGHPVLLDFWATWCGPCLISIPLIEDFYKRHKSEGLVVLGLNMDDDPAEVYVYSKRLKISYPVLFAGRSRVGSDYAIEGIPLLILIDKQGHIVQRFDGFSPRAFDAMEFELPRLLAATSAS